MLIQEFIDRTGYKPTIDEYRHIENAYYDFDGGKDDFCKWWKIQKRGGRWDRELKLREKIQAMEEEKAREIAAANETIDFYRPYFDRADVAEKLLQLVTMDFPCDISIWHKDGSRRRYHEIRVKYIPKSHNGKFDFINVIEKSGYIQSIKMADIAKIFID